MDTRRAPSRGPVLHVNEFAATYQHGDRVPAPALGRPSARSSPASAARWSASTSSAAAPLTVLPDGGDRAVVPAGSAARRGSSRLRLRHHRAPRLQGLTVDTAHVLEDGGGRELAYVKTSRATDTTHIYMEADNTSQAAEELRDAWRYEQRKLWISDTSRPDENPARTIQTPTAVEEASQRLHREAERWAIRAVIPSDHTDETCTTLANTPPASNKTSMTSATGAAEPRLSTSPPPEPPSTAERDRNREQRQRTIDSSDARRSERRKLRHALASSTAAPKPPRTASSASPSPSLRT